MRNRLLERMERLSRGFNSRIQDPAPELLGVITCPVVDFWQLGRVQTRDTDLWIAESRSWYRTQTMEQQRETNGNVERL
jgi:hypothetical protein